MKWTVIKISWIAANILILFFAAYAIYCGCRDLKEGDNNMYLQFGCALIDIICFVINTKNIIKCWNKMKD